VRASTSSCPKRASSYRFATLVQRAYSQYKHWVQVSAYGGDFEQFLADHPGAVEEGRYFVLSRYLDLFPAPQLHVVIFGDLVREPVDVMRGVFDFLGVDPSHTPPDVGAANISTRSRFHRAREPTGLFLAD